MAEPNWNNRTLFVADNVRVLRGMNSESVDCIATDPPFNKKRIFNAPLGSKQAKQRFDDRWRWDEVDRLVQACFASADYKEGRTAFMENAAPPSRIANQFPSPRFTRGPARFSRPKAHSVIPAQAGISPGPLALGERARVRALSTTAATLHYQMICCSRPHASQAARTLFC